MRGYLLSVPVVTVVTWAVLTVGCPTIEVPEDFCNTYCTKVVQNCGVTTTGDNDAQYSSVAACEVYCKQAAGIPFGNSGDEAGNTVHCRLYHAGLAALDAETHCPHAGTTGGNVCGTWCDNYCHLMGHNCAGSFPSDADCRTACAAFNTDGVETDDLGDTVQCRITFAGLAGAERGTASGLAQCELAMPDSGDCSEPAKCSDFCAEVFSACTGTDAYYASETDCNQVCSSQANWEWGVLGDSDLNTVGCRHNYAKQAAATSNADDKARFCKNASETGGDTCGSLCDNWCNLLVDNCSTDDLVFEVDDPADACYNACAAFSEGGNPGDTSGNTVQCRIFYGVAAGNPAAAGSVDQLCTSASETSSNCQ